ncbi:Uncharacterised protein [Helicobacter acinonychis]|uniref:Uncharacterized protein n=1 Tax=Helicobacter acinonychis (strain Sheeba) TaxID=382638 RepID=Q17YH0_HELAH|nr:conserved hypothetical protein fragment 2 [Helicobacter acinonychis str. Sheeba]STP04576.1 Uncharacterised protein [Helicobacter acinonychis]
MKLEVAEENQDFFKTILEEAEKGNISHCAEIIDIDTEGKKNLLEVLRTILDKVSPLNEEEINEHLEALLEMVVVWLEEPDSERAIKTFQSVNDRGVPLHLLDKFINDHFGEIFGHNEASKENAYNTQG